MATFLAVVTFAVVYAAAAAVANRISVYLLGFWDSKFVDQAGNVAVADQVLPLFVSLATLSFLAGLSLDRAAVARTALATVALVSAACGCAAAAFLLAEPSLRQLGVHRGVAGIVGTAAFWAGPAFAAAIGFRMVSPERPRNAV